MSKNKSIKQRMIKKYGAKCFIEEIGIRSKEEAQEEIQRRYSGKKQRYLMDQLTYHHILEKSRNRKSNRRKRSFTPKYKSSMV